MFSCDILNFSASTNETKYKCKKQLSGVTMQFIISVTLTDMLKHLYIRHMYL